MILITGAAGFIGSNFANFLHELNPETKIIILDKLTYAGDIKNLENLLDKKNNTFYELDICDHQALRKIFEKYKPSKVVNFAAESHVDRSISSPSAFIETNIIGTYTLLEVCKSFYENLESNNKSEFRFLHVSTDEVFGSLKKDESKFTEENQFKPNSPYAASKASSDHLCRAYFKTYNLPVLISNCSNNYGPYQYPEKLIPLCIKNAMNNKKIPIYGDGLQIRDWLYVKDHCEAIKLILDTGRVGQTYNVGGNNEITNIDIVTMICEILDKNAPSATVGSYKNLIEYVDDRKGHDRRYAVDSSKIMRELGWKPSVDFKKGLEYTIEWYLKTNNWYI
ncbi:MAG: dTDP-glucose 4,6-dehydratase [Gammaproteobacteria bacterium]